MRVHPGLIDLTFRRPRVGELPEVLLPDPAAVLGLGGGYLSGSVAQGDGRFPAGDPAGLWWAPSGRSPQHPIVVGLDRSLITERIAGSGDQQVVGVEVDDSVSAERVAEASGREEVAAGRGELRRRADSVGREVGSWP